MNLASIIIIAATALAFGLSIWQITRRGKKSGCNGACEGCPKVKNCNIK